jgi:hypothetical protein
MRARPEEKSWNPFALPLCECIPNPAAHKQLSNCDEDAVWACGVCSSNSFQTLERVLFRLLEQQECDSQCCQQSKRAPLRSGGGRT